MYVHQNAHSIDNQAHTDKSIFTENDCYNNIQTWRGTPRVCINDEAEGQY